jgi:ammonium transporter, Amt family
MKKGGSEYAVNARTANVLVVSNLAASVGGITWMFVEMIVCRKKRMSLNGFCCGAIAGLVCITSASGFVRPHYSIIFGFIGGVACFFASYIKKITKYKYDDACDVFASSYLIHFSVMTNRLR